MNRFVVPRSHMDAHAGQSDQLGDLRCDDLLWPEVGRAEHNSASAPERSIQHSGDSSAGIRERKE